MLNSQYGVISTFLYSKDPTRVVLDILNSKVGLKVKVKVMVMKDTL